MQADPEEIQKAINLMYGNYPVIELRAINKAKKIESGYFDQAHQQDLIKRATSLSNDGYQIYTVANEINHDLIARDNSNKTSFGAAATTDHDIIRRRWILIDIDSTRASAISANETEKESALKVATDIRLWLRQQDWPEAIFSDSGNGYHLNYEIDLPNDPEITTLIKSLLEGLARKFDSPGAAVDKTVFNASRIWKLYGTIAQKGSNTSDRPHRVTSIIDCPDLNSQLDIDVLHKTVALLGNGHDNQEKTIDQANGHDNDLNSTALANLDQWVPQLFPQAKKTAGGVWRVTSKSLGRNLEEDLSMAPTGITDFGTEEKFTPLGLVITFGNFSNNSEAAKWLRNRLGMGPFKPDEVFKKKDSKPDNKPKQENDDDKGFLTDLISGSTVKMREIEWLWDGWLMRGKTHILAGEPGAGKTTLALTLMAIISVGGRWPDGTKAKIGNVVFWSGEDDLSDTIMPRFVAAGGDPKRFFWVNGCLTSNGKRIPFDPAEHMELLMNKISQIGEVECVSIDPQARIIKNDMNTSNAVMKSLACLRDLAEVCNCAFLGISHLGKGTQGKKALDRILGSISIAGQARGNILAFEYKDPPEGIGARVMVKSKYNCAASTGGWRYNLVQKLVPGETFHTNAIEWGDVVYGNADEVSERAEETEERREERSKEDDAMDFIKDELRNGPKSLRHVLNSAESVGHSERTIRRAARKIGVIGDGENKARMWKLP